MSDDGPIERRPNPPGWVPPRKGSNYNPYDPREQRPPEGYPSEFKTPGKRSAWATVPNDATQYQHMKETMQKLQYTPRPKSELYPGQYKVLRRVDNYPRFYKGGLFVTRMMALGVGIYAVFIYRWNDGYDHIFSPMYRLRLRIKYIINGELSDTEMDDLIPKRRGYVQRPSMSVESSDSYIVNEKPTNSKYVMEKPNERQLREAQRIMQDSEERYLRALDIAEEQIAKGNIEKSAPIETQTRKKLFGIF